jgi:hypothetical protein
MLRFLRISLALLLLAGCSRIKDLPPLPEGGDAA